MVRRPRARLASSLLRHHLTTSPHKAVSVVLRACPPRLRRPVGTLAGRVGRPDVLALARAAGGDAGAARGVLEEVLDAGRARRGGLRRVARAALVLDLPDVAGRALQSLPDADPWRPALCAEVLVAQGRLDTVEELLTSSPEGLGGDLRRRVVGELEVLRHEVLDAELRRAPGPRPWTPDPRRVLHVVSNALPQVQAGYTIRTQGLVAAQRRRGDTPHVVSRLGFPVDTGLLNAADSAEVDGVPHHYLLPSRIPPVGADRQRLWVDLLEDLARRVRPAVLHAHSKHDNAQAALAVGHRFGVPVVYEVRGMLEETWRSRRGEGRDSAYYRLAREAETTCMARAAAVVTLGETLREEIVARGIPAERVHVVPNCVSEDVAAPPPERAEARRRWGIPDGATVFGTVTTLNAYEGIDVLVEAAGRLDDQVRLLVVGDGPEAAALRRLAAPLGERVRFVGRLPHAQVRGVLAAMDVFCVPRRATPVTVLVPPLKPVEAMAAGLPVLASDLPPLRETVRPDRFGRLAPAGDAVAWAEQMDALRYAPADVQVMGQDAREWVLRERTWTAAADRCRAVYDQVLGLRLDDRRTDREEHREQ